jgi:hypothetical protein
MPVSTDRACSAGRRSPPTVTCVFCLLRSSGTWSRSLRAGRPTRTTIASPRGCPSPPGLRTNAPSASPLSGFWRPMQQKHWPSEARRVRNRRARRPHYTNISLVEQIGRTNKRVEAAPFRDTGLSIKRIVLFVEGVGLFKEHLTQSGIDLVLRGTAGNGTSCAPSLRHGEPASTLIRDCQATGFMAA